MKYVFLFYLFFSITFISHAQLMNIDKASQDTVKKPKVFSGSIALTIDMDEQKANIFDEDGSIELAYIKPKNVLVMHAISEIVTGGPSNTALNSRSLQFRDRMFTQNRLHPELFAQYQYDQVKGLQNRLLAGANARYIIKDKGTFRIFAATGFMYEFEDWNYKGILNIHDVPPNKNDTTRGVIKSTSYIRFSKYFGSKVDFSLVVFYQAQPDLFFKSPRIAEFAQLNFDISDHFSLDFEYDSMYDTNPLVPIKKYYFSFNEGLTVKF